MQMCARDLSGGVDPAHFFFLFFLQRAVRRSETKQRREKHSGFWLCSAGYLWRGSIHPLVLCGYEPCGWEFWEAMDGNEATAHPKTPPPSPRKHVGGWRGPRVPPAFEIWGSRVRFNTHIPTLGRARGHTRKTNTTLRGIPDLCLHLRSYYSPFCCQTNGSLQSDLLSDSSCPTVRVNLSSFLLH